MKIPLVFFYLAGGGGGGRGGRRMLIKIITVSLEIISLASLMVATVISSFPFYILLFLAVSYPYCFPQKPQIQN